MKKIIHFFVLGLLFGGCATSNKLPSPSCTDEICFVSNPTGRIKNVIYSKRKQPVFIKEIIWVPTTASKSQISQGHVEFELMPTESSTK